MAAAIDLHKLDYREFEHLAGLLLEREHHQLIREPSQGSRGPDYETLSPEGNSILVEVKLLRNWNHARHDLARLSEDVERYRKQKPNARGLLILAASLNEEQKATLKSNYDNVDIWDGAFLLSLLAKHKDLQALFSSTIAASAAYDDQIQKLWNRKSSKAAEFENALKAIPCGRAHWRDYERVCTEVLTYVLAPDLAAPDIQSRSDDGLDIIDAIFPIRASRPPWGLVRSEYRTRFVVAEFKNYCDPISQIQVDSLAQYLWRPAQRFFGLLVSRHLPSANALAQRRRKWLEEEKCIVFLNDSDLIEMLQLHAATGQAFDVVDAQLEAFFRTLTP